MANASLGNTHLFLWFLRHASLHLARSSQRYRRDSWLRAVVPMGACASFRAWYCSNCSFVRNKGQSYYANLCLIHSQTQRGQGRGAVDACQYPWDGSIYLRTKCEHPRTLAQRCAMRGAEASEGDHLLNIRSQEGEHCCLAHKMLRWYGQGWLVLESTSTSFASLSSPAVTSPDWCCIRRIDNQRAGKKPWGRPTVRDSHLVSAFYVWLSIFSSTYACFGSFQWIWGLHSHTNGWEKRNNPYYPYIESTTALSDIFAHIEAGGQPSHSLIDPIPRVMCVYWTILAAVDTPDIFLCHGV